MSPKLVLIDRSAIVAVILTQDLDIIENLAHRSILKPGIYSDTGTQNL